MGFALCHINIIDIPYFVIQIDLAFSANSKAYRLFPSEISKTVAFAPSNASATDFCPTG